MFSLDNEKKGSRQAMSEDIITKILDRNNLNEAFKRVKANKGASGIDDMDIEETKVYIKEHKNTIVWQLYNRKYQPQPVRRVEIPKPNGGKRKLGIPTVLDRIIQQAMVQVLSPMFEPHFSDNSYGFRPNRSCEKAIIKALEFMNDGYDWIVDIDLEKFFDNVPHDKLLRLVSDVVKDGNVVSLVNKFLKAGVMVENEFEETMVGTPQGGPLSPLLSNVILNKLDKELEARGLNFVRYADDIIILVKSEKAANRVMASITKFIEKKLGLKVNVEKSKVARPNQIKYLGYGFYYTKTGIIKPKPHLKSIQKFKRKLKQLTKRSWSISLDERITKLNQVIRGWINYFKIADMKTCMTIISEHLRRRIRCIIWKQWKVPRKRIPALVKLGADIEQAKALAFSRKSYWNSSLFIGIYITNKRLKQKGLVFPLDHYLKVHTVI